MRAALGIDVHTLNIAAMKLSAARGKSISDNELWFRSCWQFSLCPLNLLLRVLDLPLRFVNFNFEKMTFMFVASNEHEIFHLVFRPFQALQRASKFHLALHDQSRFLTQLKIYIAAE